MSVVGTRDRNRGPRRAPGPAAPLAAASRALVILLAPVAAFIVPAAGATAAPQQAGEDPKPAPQGFSASRKTATRNVVLVTLDGLRTQELFGGMDAVIAENEKKSGIYDLERARKRYWRDTAEERRLALMPFFWGTLAPRGIVLGNKEKGSHVTMRNPLLFSGPGYQEILTGQYQPDVVSNDLIRYPHQTVLEFAQRELGLPKTGVATFGSWEGFGYLSSSREGAFFTNTGYEKVPPAIATPRMALLDDLQFQVMGLWETGRSDAITFGLALEYLKTQRPRLLYLALGEPDDWAHARRYDRLLDYLNVADGYLRRLWQTLQATEGYRGRTSLIVLTDHGRGVRPSDWVDHDENVAGSEDIWILVAGPDTPARGELGPYPTVYQADVAATLLRLLGLDDRKFNPDAGPPIPAAFK